MNSASGAIVPSSVSSPPREMKSMRGNSDHSRPFTRAACRSIKTEQRESYFGLNARIVPSFCVSKDDLWRKKFCADVYDK